MIDKLPFDFAFDQAPLGLSALWVERLGQKLKAPSSVGWRVERSRNQFLSSA
ncbi:hypothetical protein H6F86_27005 [Phormidium sp. FACHB-592]|uniref:Uncharacterized protein n=1 Tax=Stenomitos frigidus AS-A4 TaxID=2933935 RepID=A0ABV0KC84_9CYAN|nr:hypothetical protein [Phormidium sp. FACHB-592]MBD2077467.1 hypothetical protein [Phormidium sp. FACHB-592]